MRTLTKKKYLTRLPQRRQEKEVTQEKDVEKQKKQNIIWCDCTTHMYYTQTRFFSQFANGIPAVVPAESNDANEAREWKETSSHKSRATSNGCTEWIGQQKKTLMGWTFYNSTKWKAKQKTRTTTHKTKATTTTRRRRPPKKKNDEKLHSLFCVRTHNSAACMVRFVGVKIARRKLAGGFFFCLTTIFSFCLTTNRVWARSNCHECEANIYEAICGYVTIFKVKNTPLNICMQY